MKKREYIERDKALEICEAEYRNQLKIQNYGGDTVAWNIGSEIKRLPVTDRKGLMSYVGDTVFYVSPKMPYMTDKQYNPRVEVCEVVKIVLEKNSPDVYYIQNKEQFYRKYNLTIRVFSTDFEHSVFTDMKMAEEAVRELSGCNEKGAEQNEN